MEAQFQTQQHFLEDTNLVRVIETMVVQTSGFGAVAGGAGANGGQGATNNGSGGGGSGYASDEVELLPAVLLPTGTQVGGNDDVGFICFELFRENDDHTPFIPPNQMIHVLEL